MKFLRRILDAQHKHFEPGARFERLYPFFEANDAFLFTPGQVTAGPSHVRDAVDLKRIMITVAAALVPCVLMALYNTGYQANLMIAEHGASPLPGWRTALFDMLGFVHDPASMWASLVLGALYFVPIFVVGFAVGALIEVGFAVVRGHEVNEGFLVTGFLYPLVLPPTLPLWQVALGIAFATIIGKEIFGGTGMNVLNPALLARAFVFFAYPAYMSGEVWVAAGAAADGTSGATWLARLADGTGELAAGQLELVSGEMVLPWWDAFTGSMAGSMGETSALACLLGAAVLIFSQVGSWRTMAGVTVGTLVMCLTLNAIGSETNPLFSVPFHWHILVGGWAFGTVFMATDPVSSAFTDRGKWIYGAGIGLLVVLVRVVNPAYPEGMMLSILFMNMFAPLIDHFVVRANIQRRAARYGA